MRTITFKSYQENWRKEYLGLKKNTVRILTDKNDGRKILLDRFIDGSWNAIDIFIINEKTGEQFNRRVTDVTLFNGIYIISWGL